MVVFRDKRRTDDADGRVSNGEELSGVVSCHVCHDQKQGVSVQRRRLPSLSITKVSKLGRCVVCVKGDLTIIWMPFSNDMAGCVQPRDQKAQRKNWKHHSNNNESVADRLGVVVVRYWSCGIHPYYPDLASPYASSRW